MREKACIAIPAVSREKWESSARKGLESFCYPPFSSWKKTSYPLGKEPPPSPPRKERRRLAVYHAREKEKREGREGKKFSYTGKGESVGE